ncbi:MAG: winged helix-turn-helix domain-containing protein [Acidobacteriota bacterium]
MKHLYRFGDFYLDPQNKSLLKDQATIQLAPKTFDTLLVLVEKNGNVVTKDELLQKVWQGAAIEENNLNQQISALRKTLGEAPDGMKFIETIPKRGYKFVAPVEEVDDAIIIEKHKLSRVVIEHRSGEQAQVATAELTDPATKVLPETQQSFWQTRQKVIAAFLILLMLIGGYTIWRYFKPVDSPEAQWSNGIIETQLISVKANVGGGIGSCKFSPDGKLVAYTDERDNYLNIRVTKVGSNVSRAITDEKSINQSPVWSPDGGQIAFLSDRGSKLGLWAVDSFGGAPKPLITFDDFGEKGKEGKPSLIKWSKNEKIYYQWGSNLFSVDLNSKAISQITSFDQTKFFTRDFDISADENYIVYLDKQNNQSDIWQLPMQGGTPVQLTSDAATERSPLWYPDGKHLVYKSITDATNQICLYNLESREITQIKLENDDGALRDISPDGQQILYSQRKIESDIWKLDVDNPEEIPLTAESDLESWADASPDGTTIAYQVIKGTQGRWDFKESRLFIKPIASESPATELAAKAYDPQWSPDGKSIAFLRVVEGFHDLCVISAMGGQERNLVAGNVQYGGSVPPAMLRSLPKDYCWSPDSSKIAYSYRQDEVNNIWVVAADGSDNRKISNNLDTNLEVKCPMWSPDGKRLAYISGYTPPPNENQRWSLWVSDSDKPVFQTASVLQLLGWAGENEFIVASVENERGNKANLTKVTLSKISPAGEQKIATLESTYLANIYLSPDGKQVAFVAVQNGKGNIYLMPVGGGEVKPLTNNPDPRVLFSTLNWSADSKTLFYGKTGLINGLTLITSKGDE